MAETEKILEKLKKLKAHADSAKEIGSEAEAEAFAAMLQQLLMKHKLAMTDVEFAAVEREEPVGRYPVDWQDIAVRSNRVQWIERLGMIVAKAHFCQLLVHPRSSNLTLVGRKTDAEVAEYMLVTLVRATEQLAEKAYVKYFYECRDAGDVSQARGFKAAFVRGFISRISERYEAERASANSNSMALVRLNKSDEAVRRYMMGIGTRRASSLSRQVAAHGEGIRRGTAAADAVNLRSNALGGSGKPSGLLR